MIGRIALFSALLLVACKAPAHDPETGSATAIRNEGVLVEVGDTRILFDPIYDNDFGTYHELSGDLARSITRGEPPYDEVDAVFVTHAHGDHFSADGLVSMLTAQPSLALYVPGQALEMMREADEWASAYESRVRPIALDFGASQSFALGATTIEAFAIPHAGWPQNHQQLQHYVYRVSFDEGARVMHLGDASHDAVHYEPHESSFKAGRTGIAFVPFWMLLDPEAKRLVDDMLNADHVVGIHVPTDVPPSLRDSGEDYFSILGETRDLPAVHDH